MLFSVFDQPPGKADSLSRLAAGAAGCSDSLPPYSRREIGGQLLDCAW
ncbi:MAG: hypothetical protein OXI01_21720 [Albidovulum sp.]|nr:hypothetical protein [Albidovulum sp.]